MKIDIISGFLGAGKTTLIKKLIDGYKENEHIAIIENEFGDISIDGAILKDSNVNIEEISSGCICCTIVGDYTKTIEDVIKNYKPSYLIIEPSGVAKLSEILLTTRKIANKYKAKINHVITVIDTINFKSYFNNFGEFYKDQIKSAKTIICSKIDLNTYINIEELTNEIRTLNKEASIITAPLADINFDDLIYIADRDIYEKNDKKLFKTESNFFSKKVKSLSAEKVFEYWGIEENKEYSIKSIKNIFYKFELENIYGNILRGKGIVKNNDGIWYEFNYTPGTFQSKKVTIQNSSKIVIIGSNINKNKLNALFKEIS